MSYSHKKDFSATPVSKGVYVIALSGLFLLTSFNFILSPKKVYAQNAGTLVTSGVVYNADSSANSARSRNTTIKVPVNLINVSQGWMAARMKMGFPSTTSLSPDPNIMDMSESNTNSHFIYYDAGSDTFHFERVNGTVASPAQNFSTGAFKTIIVTWNSSQIKISIDGGPFNSLNNTDILAQTAFYIGSSAVQGTLRQPDSDYYWVAGGSGFLTDTNASSIHSFGNTDNPRSTFPGGATFIWWANNDQYNNDGVIPATNTPTPTVVPTSPPGALLGDANGDGIVDGTDFVAWLTHYNQATQNGIGDGDFNTNGKVDGIDYAIWLANFGRTRSTNTPTPPPQVTSIATNTPLPTQTITSTNTPTARPISTSTPLPTSPQVTVPPSSGSGIWVSSTRLAQLPTTGAAWDAVRSEAYGSWGTADISNQDMTHDTSTLAGALVYARTGDSSLRTKVADAIMSAIETENGGRTLALGRNLASYVISADLINLKQFRSTDDSRFRTWLSGVRRETLDGMTLIECHEKRPNNWGTHCGSSRAAADVYLGDTTDLARTAQVFKGFLGDRSSYAGFEYGELSWQCNSSAPVGINPVGCTKDGHNIDGVIPDDQRRSGSFSWPPPKANYVYGNLSGAITQANILYNAGYDTWNWQNQALKRAYVWLHTQANFPADGDDKWQPHLVNYIYGTSFPASIPAGAGKHMGWTDWTHAR